MFRLKTTAFNLQLHSLFGPTTRFNPLNLSQLMLHICRVSKMFGEWYQKTNKTEDTNKLTLLAFKIISILHNTL
jgi:hypothetical protein